MTLRGRLLASSLSQIGLLGALFLAMGLFLRAQVLPLIEEYVRSKTLRMAHSLAGDADVALATSDTALLERAVAPVTRDPDFAGVLIRDVDGRVRLARGPAAQGSASPASPGTLVEAPETFSAWAPVAFEGMKLGWVAVWFGKARLRAVSRGLLALGLAAAVTLFLAVLFSVRFSRAFVAPIGTMMEFSRKVADGRLAERLEGTAEGELGELVKHMNAMTSALESRDTSLALRQSELEASLSQLRKTQEELLQSTRLASVGEMAGRTAHEVLNPITSIRGRATKLLQGEDLVASRNRKAFEAIVSGWEQSFAQGGADALLGSLSRPVPAGNGTRTLLDEDLANLKSLHVYFTGKAEQDRKDVEFLLHEVDRVAHIIDGMRNLARQHSAVAPTSVVDVIMEAVEISRDGAEKRNIRISTAFDARPTALCDRYELVQVLTNVLRNAMQAIEEKHGRAGGAIDIRLSAGAEKASVQIRDDGGGIAQEHLPYIFESGFTTRAPSEGTGLGLSISRRLARGFHGDLLVEEVRPGEGTTFRLDLPHLP